MVTSNILNSSQANQLTAIKSTRRTLDEVQLNLATGRDVNSALDNPQNFFEARSHDNRANDLSALIDNISQTIRTAELTDEGIRAALQLIDQAEALLEKAQEELRYVDGDPDTGFTFDGASDFTSYSGGQDSGAPVTVIGDNEGVLLQGNVWKRADLNYEITADTILRFDFQSTEIPEIAAIGFDNDSNFSNNSEHFFLYGTQRGGISYAAPTTQFEYDGSGDTVTIEIDIGSYFTGNFSGIHFINDDDVNPTGNSSYQNIRLFEAGASSIVAEEPSQVEFFENEYAKIVDQLDALVEDATYRGVGLINNTDMRTYFNETRSTFIDIKGIDATSSGLGLTQRRFSSADNLQRSLDQVREAKEELRSYSRTLSSDLNTIKIRRSHTLSKISNLQSARDDLIVADQNEQGSKLLALQTRQQIQVTTLSLSASDAILNIFS